MCKENDIHMNIYISSRHDKGTNKKSRFDSSYSICTKDKNDLKETILYF